MLSITHCPKSSGHPRPPRGRPRRCGPAPRHRRRQPRPHPQRIRVCSPLRRRTNTRNIRQNRQSSPSQPRRRPGSQRSALPHRHMPTPLGPRHPRLRRATHQGRPLKEGHHPLPQALHRPRSPRRHTNRSQPQKPCLTSIGASRNEQVRSSILLSGSKHR